MNVNSNLYFPVLNSINAENFTFHMDTNINVDVSGKSVILIYGEASSGKTTLIHAIMSGIFGKIWYQLTRKNFAFRKNAGSRRRTVTLEFTTGKGSCRITRNLVTSEIEVLHLNQKEITSLNKEDKYYTWFNDHSGLLLEEVALIFTHCYVIEEGNRKYKPIWQEQEQVKLLEILLHNRAFSSDRKTMKQVINDAEQENSRLKTANKSLETAVQAIKYSLKLPDKDAPMADILLTDVLSPGKRSELKESLAKLRSQNKMLRTEDDELKAKIHGLEKKIENLYKSKFTEEAKNAKQMFKSSLMDIFLENLKENFCLFCEQEPKTDKWKERIWKTDSCIICKNSLQESDETSQPLANSEAINNKLESLLKTRQKLVEQRVEVTEKRERLEAKRDVLLSNFENLKNEPDEKIEQAPEDPLVFQTETISQTVTRNLTQSASPSVTQSVSPSASENKTSSAEKIQDTTGNNKELADYKALLEIQMLAKLIQKNLRIIEQNSKLKQTTEEKLSLIIEQYQKTVTEKIEAIKKQTDKWYEINDFTHWKLIYQEFSKSTLKHKFKGFRPMLTSRTDKSATVKLKEGSDTEDLLIDLIFRVSLLSVLINTQQQNGFLVVESLHKHIDDKRIDKIVEFFTSLQSQFQIIITENKMQSSFLQKIKENVPKNFIAEIPTSEFMKKQQKLNITSFQRRSE